MFLSNKVWSSLIGFSLLFGAAPGAIAQASEAAEEQSQFRRIEQPLAVKVGVTLGGFTLIGAELWWFLLKKKKVQQAQVRDGFQEVTITVDGGYQPDYVVVQAGQPVRLNFFRKDANSCLEEVLLPDFGLSTVLPINETKRVEFTPQRSGEFQFTCGMRMFRGTITVQSGATDGQEVASRQAAVTADVATLSPANSHSLIHSNGSTRTAHCHDHAPEGSTHQLEQSPQAQLRDGMQEFTITVEQGYIPNRIIVKAGKPVRLNFFRKDPSICLEKVLLPDFKVATDLPLNQATSVKFTPAHPGEYRFTCGMEMFHGIVEVQARASDSKQTAN